MRVLRSLSVLVTMTLAAVGPATAWTGPTRVAMVDDAIKLMPPTLRRVLEKRRRDVLRGMLEPMTHEDAASHRPSWDRGSLDASVEDATLSLVKDVGKQPFAQVARRFGVLAHFVVDAGFPPGASRAPDPRRYAHFASFCESRRAKFPLVFYGHDNAALSKGDRRAFTIGVLNRALGEDETLARAYAAAPRWDDPIAFDDRSVPFAIASIAYSHAVTDVVQAWLAAWTLCHGDLGGTPYAKPGSPR